MLSHYEEDLLEACGLCSLSFVTVVAVPVEHEIRHLIDHMDEYMAPKKVSTDILNIPGWSYIYKVSRPLPSSIQVIFTCLWFFFWKGDSAR